MRNLKVKIYKGLANVFMVLGVTGAVTYSIPWHWYEPKVPNSLLEEESKK